jgi:hypothetical protein
MRGFSPVFARIVIGCCCVPTTAMPNRVLMV